jgi:hypothetical protein
MVDSFKSIGGKVTLFPTTTAYTNSQTNLKLTRNKMAGHELSLSDDNPSVDAADLSLVEQVANLVKARRYAESCYICGTSKPVVNSYNPLRGVNQDTMTALRNNGIANTTFLAINFKSVLPTAFDIAEASEQVDNGQDVVLHLTTEDMDVLVLNQYYNNTRVFPYADYPLGIKALLKKATDLGYEVKKVSEY